MADSTQVRSDIQVFLQRKTAARLKNLLFTKMPTLEFFFALSEESKKDADGLGRPGAGDLAIGRANGISAPRKAKMFAERVYMPIQQISKPAKTEAKSMTDYDSAPVVPAFGTTNKNFSRFKQSRFHFSRKSMPYKVAHSEIRTAKSGSGSPEAQAAATVGSIYDVEVKTRTAVLAELINDELFGVNSQPGFPTNEDTLEWDHIHSIQSALDTDNTYGGIDRTLSANDYWRSHVVTTPFSGTFGDLVEECNYTLGMIDQGLGVQVIAVGKDLIRRAKAEAKAEGYTVMRGDIADPEYGFKRDMVCIYSGSRKVFVYYEPAMNAVDTASGTKNAFCLDPSTWTFAIPGDRNFKVSKPIAANEVDEGGDEADFGTIETEILLCCEVPKGNARFTNIV